MFGIKLTSSGYKYSVNRLPIYISNFLKDYFAFRDACGAVFDASGSPVTSIKRIILFHEMFLTFTWQIRSNLASYHCKRSM